MVKACGFGINLAGLGLIVRYGFRVSVLGPTGSSSGNRVWMGLVLQALSCWVKIGFKAVDGFGCAA